MAARAFLPHEAKRLVKASADVWKRQKAILEGGMGMRRAPFRARSRKGLLPAEMELLDGMLIGASRKGDLELVRELVAHGADVNARGEKGATPLLMAVENMHAAIAKLLLEAGADVDTRGRYGPLLNEANITCPEIAELLIAKGADVNAKDQYGQTALFTASSYNRAGIARLLLEHGAHVNVRALNGNTPLIEASMCGNNEIVELLLENGADASLRMDRGWTASFFAAVNDHQDTVMLLRRYGATE